MSTFINTRDVVGEQVLVNSILDGSCKTLYTEYKDDVLTKTCALAFYQWTALTMVDLPNLTGVINANTFKGCSALSAVVLRGSTIPTLSSTAFTNTPIASGTGYIYVPAALVDSYKAATNWSTYANQFRALEDYTVDGTTTGDLDETKIYENVYYEIGAISYENPGGTDTDATNRFRTGFVSFDGSGTISILGTDVKYSVTVRGYDANWNYAAANGAWIALPGTLTFDYPYLRFIIKKTDDEESNVSLEDLNDCTLIVDGVQYRLYPKT